MKVPAPFAPSCLLAVAPFFCTWSADDKLEPLLPIVSFPFLFYSGCSSYLPLFAFRTLIAPVFLSRTVARAGKN
jgi:hypothetical protein